MRNYLRLMRVQDWLKSTFVFIGCIYSRQWQEFGLLSLGAAVAFCLIASAVYIYNDIKDIAADKAHPIKCQRPIASGQVTQVQAYALMCLLLVSGLSLGFIISPNLMLILASYLAINLAYNHGLKRIAYVDILCIASGFLLRILAGTIGIGIPLSRWLLMCGTLLSLFIALCKRKLELRLVQGTQSRFVLGNYNPTFISIAMLVSGIGCVLSYSVYAYKVGFLQLHSGYMLTIPFVAFGLYRLWILASCEINNDDPIKLLLHDKLSWVNLITFTFVTLYALTQ